MRALILCTVILILQAMPTAFAGSPGWRRVGNTADDVIYAGKVRTFYRGCVYTSDGDSDGSGSVDHAACGYQGPDKQAYRAAGVEWEHNVPASLMAARQFECRVFGRIASS